MPQVGEGIPPIEEHSFFVAPKYRQRLDSRKLQRTTDVTYVDHWYDPKEDTVTRQVGEGIPPIVENSFFVVTKESQQPDSSNPARVTDGTYVDHRYNPKEDTVTSVVVPFQT